MNEPPTDWHVAADLGASVWDLYERYLVPAIFGPWAVDLLELAELRDGDRVLDVACGTGAVARLVRRSLGDIGRVVGCDLNAEMLEVARAASSGLAIEWRQGDACDLPFSEAEFDLVLCQQGLQFVPDRAGALREMSRVLRWGGRAVVAEWCSIDHSPGFVALADAIERHLNAEAANGLRSGPFGFGAMEELESALAAAEFEDVRVEHRERVLTFPSSAEFVRRYIAGSPLASAFAGASDEALERVTDDVVEAFGTVGSNGALGFSIASYVGIGHR